MSASSSGFRFRFALLLGASLGLAALTAHYYFFRPEPPAPERPLTELIRVDGRFVLRSDTNQVFSGWIAERYDSGVLRSRSRVVGGVLEGVSEGWHTNGVRQVEEHFVSGVSEGPVTKWHASGAKLSEGIAHRGQLEGMFRRWHANGVRSEEVNLVAGEPEGVARSWFPSGSLKAEVTLKSGQVLTQKFWKDGEQVPEPVLAQAGKTP